MKKLNLKYIAIIAIIAFCSFIVANNSKIYIDNGVDFVVFNMENPPGDHPFLSIRVNSETGLGMFLEQNGRVIIGTVDPCLLVIPSDTVKLMVHGEAWKTGSPFWEGVSDARLKNDITPMEESLEKLLGINLYDYEYNDQPGRKYCGILAQEIQSDFPQSVRTFIQNGEEYYSFNPNNLFFTVIKGTQELAQRVITQEEQLRELEAELEAERRLNAQQQAEIDAIKAALAQHGIKISKPTTNATTKPNPDSKPPVTTPKRMSVGNDVPQLSANIPNPANSSTSISYYLPQNTQQATLVIQDMMGMMIAEYALPTNQGEGMVEVDFSRLNLKSGAYTYRLNVNNRLIDTKKMILSTRK